MRKSIIVAMGQNRAIGKDNQIPWHLPEDLKRFKEITSGHPIIMGRKTFESMGKPLPKRTNIVVTRNKDWKAEGTMVVENVEKALEAAKESPGAEEIFLIGGNQIFKEALKFADRIYLTIVEKEFDADVFFPDVNLNEVFDLKEEHRGHSSKEPDLAFTYYLGERIPKGAKPRYDFLSPRVRFG